ncbi:MAG TPA: D-glycero-beta-D-manno-heptose 1-phosphate adenylyltransferase [Bacteroidales bacterium]|nr:D-glycero-beta-D-manno-heptose 1-phosphate adenylyltransferase [Bacteroidales bacterium]
MPRLNAVYEKILSGEALDRWLRVTSFRRKSVVFTNGCFDILHSGHIQYLAKASSMGDFLFIGLNTDASVKKLKGPDRPYQDENTRALVLAALGFVTAVALFDEETPYNLISKVQPDVLVKGGDYKVEDIVGYDIVKAKGGKVLTIPFVEGFSSSNIINKIRST